MKVSNLLHGVQSLQQAPGFNLLSYYDFRGASTAEDVTYTKRWPRALVEGEIPCCFPGVAGTRVIPDSM